MDDGRESSLKRRRESSEENGIESDGEREREIGLKERKLEQQVLRCPKCPPSSLKRFRPGRSYTMHLKEVHREAESEMEQALKEAIDFTNEMEAISPDSDKLKLRDWQKKDKGHPDWVHASRSGDISTLKDLLSKGTWNWDQKDRHGSTAEHYAAGAGQLECLKFCISFRRSQCAKHSGEKASHETEQKCTCEPLLQRRKDGRSSLHWAARNGQSEVVKYLIEECEMSADLATFDGTTPLMYATFGGHLHVAEQLIHYGADPYKTNNWDCDLAHWIAISRCQDAKVVGTVCSWVQDHVGLDFTRPQKEGRTPLHKAAYIGNKGMLDWMLGPSEQAVASHVGKGKPVSSIAALKKDKRYPPLHMTLIQLGEYLAKQDLAESTAAQLAEKAGHHDLATRLCSLQEFLQ